MKTLVSDKADKNLQGTNVHMQQNTDDTDIIKPKICFS